MAIYLARLICICGVTPRSTLADGLCLLFFRPLLVCTIMNLGLKADLPNRQEYDQPNLNFTPQIHNLKRIHTALQLEVCFQREHVIIPI
jgi:hypothetical protein